MDRSHSPTSVVTSLSPTPHILASPLAPAAMFAVLLHLVGKAVIAGEENYADIMRANGADGPRFVKPQRGHEDGCVNGVCFESHAGEFVNHEA
eukprot:CAMPEP_0172181670 /NCGR_PEP_ID=MMETSP1050-20130122/17953_1 /TAXON_ID=233186 /ORGANISM="Cryptomonas curvata, Strain CCAP979/52" /LENGTH=92 /DNA_ID=CAMNT_0012854991 /DNA_START=252 /DNA_END=530 /DNA_ORIENTATION=-